MWLLKPCNEDGSPTAETGSTFALFPGRRYFLGRDAKLCHISFSGDVSMSRKHAAIEIKETEAEISDQGSTYGTYCGQEAILTSSQGSQDERLKGYRRISPRDVADSPLLIRLGLYSTLLSLQYSKLTVTSSSLHLKDKKSLISLCNSLNFKYSDVWTEEITHVATPPRAVLTLKG